MKDFINDTAAADAEAARDLWVDYAKGIGIILVVYGHVLGGFLLSNPEAQYPVLMFTLRALYSFHMPLFFFLAGLFAEGSLSRRGKKQFIIDKVKIIVYPYLLWSFLQGELEFLFSSHISAAVSQADILAILYQPRSQFWFLYSLFLMYLLYAALSGMKKKSSATIVLLSLLLYFFPIKSAFMDAQHFSMSLIFFACGIIYRSTSIDEILAGKLSLRNVFSVLIFFSVLAAVRFLILSGSVSFITMPLPVIYATALVLAAAGIFSVVMLSKYLARRKIFIMLMRAGFYSMPIYLAHGVFGSGTRVAFNKFFGIQSPAIVITAGIICGIFIPVFIYRASARLGFTWLFTLDKIKDSGKIK